MCFNLCQAKKLKYKTLPFSRTYIWDHLKEIYDKLTKIKAIVLFKKMNNDKLVL